MPESVTFSELDEELFAGRLVRSGFKDAEVNTAVLDEVDGDDDDTSS